MTLEMLQTIHQQISDQLVGVLTQKVVEQEVIRFTNAIELLASKKLMEQLIQQEHSLLARPPGATGPNLPRIG